MGPSTFSFMLRWYRVPFALGIFMLYSSYYFFSLPDDPPGAPYQSIPGLFAWPLSGICLVFGIVCIAFAWFKASKLRGG